MKTEQKVLIGRESICTEYGITKQTFKELVKMGAPIKILKGTKDGIYFTHKDALNEFIRKQTTNEPAESLRVLPGR